VTLTVTQASTDLMLVSATSPSVWRQKAAVTAMFSVVAPGAGTPTGTVQFQMDGSNTGSPVAVSTSGGVTTASFSTSTLSAGSHTLTASYSGDSTFSAS